MLAGSSLLTTLLLALAIAIPAKPAVLERKSFVKLTLTKRHSLANHNLVERDRRRVKSLRRRAGDQDDSDPINTVALFQTNLYTVPVGIGNPAKFYDLVLDSGSSNIWVGASNKTYVQTNTSQQTHNQMGVNYGSGSFLGNEFTDQVTISSSLVIANQPIGVALQLTGFFNFGVDGILGIGPTDRTIGSLSPDTNSTIPTVTDSLFASGKIHENLVAVALQPFNKSNSKNPSDIIVASGEINWGGIDNSLFIGNITFTPITSTPKVNTFWGIDASVTYGTTVLSNITAGIVDTGTNFLGLASEVFIAYKAATGASLDALTGLLTITSTQFNHLEGLSFTISGVAFTLTPDAQIMPQYLNTVMGGVANQIYLIVNNIGNATGGPSFIFGTAALERFYCVFDTANKRVGLANTPFTNAKLNLN